MMSTYGVIQLGDIDLPKLKLVKETYLWLDGHDHSRWIFQTRGNHSRQLFFKIWNPSYIRRDHLLEGLDSGFYDETTIPAFQAVILANGICRGYVTQKCLPHRKIDPIFHNRILEKTAQTGYFCVQYSRYHAMRYGEKLSLVDLEAIHPLHELPTLASDYHCFFDDTEYERFVIDLYCRTFPHLGAPKPIKRPSQSDSQHPILRPYRKIRSIYRTLRRRWEIRLKTIFNHLDQIEY